MSAVLEDHGFMANPGAVPPACPAATTADGRVEHAQPDEDQPTLCGIPASEVVMYRHLFYGDRPDDCSICAERVWQLPPDRWSTPRDPAQPI